MIAGRRSGRHHRYVLTRRGRLQVNEGLRKCVCFITYEMNGELKLAGTGFFLGEALGPSRPSGSEAHHWGGTVTARHVIDGIRKSSDDGKVLLRVNDREDDAWSVVESDVDEWLVHPAGPTFDVAVLPWLPPLKLFDHLTYTLEQIVDDELIYQENVSPGDEVFIAGLFVRHPGAEWNTPIVRVGNIAALPDEPVMTALGEMEAYLIEARSIGGLSGSPVFLSLGVSRRTPSRPVLTLHRVDTYLLGVMHGHWNVALNDPQAEAVNMGIGIVSPISHVLEVFAEHKEFEEMKKKAEQKVREEDAPTMDAAIEAESEFERFRDLTDRVIRVPKRELDEKRKEDS